MSYRLISILIVCCLFTTRLYAQISAPGGVIYCPHDPDNENHARIPYPKNLIKEIRQKARQSNNDDNGFRSNIVVNYNGFTDEARTAFQFAVDIWAQLLDSDVPIYVDANFVSFDNPGTIGAAGPTQIFRSFDGASKKDTWYGVALAEKMAGRDLNEPGAADINATFSRDFTFYFGLDGETPASLTDFVTVVLHELGHGLGFFSVARVDDAGVGFSLNGDFTDIYTTFINNDLGISILDLPNESFELANYLVGRNLSLNAPNATKANGDVEPLIFAPRPYNPGSSIAHLDENVFPPDNINTLMTPQIGRGQSALDPGPVTMSLFADMGWVHTRIETEERPVIINDSDSITFTAQVNSDTLLREEGLVLNYSFDDFTTVNSVAMIQSGSNYTVNILSPSEDTIIEYYFDGIKDTLGRNYRAPSAGAGIESYVSVILDPIEVNPPDSNFFETDNDGFISVNLAGTPFERGSSTITGKDGANSGTNSWVTGLDQEQYEDNTESYLLTPFYDFNLLGDYDLSFWTKYEFEEGWDGFIVEYSLDTGSTWVKVRNELVADEWYNIASTAASVFGNAEPIFSGSTENEFLKKNADLSFLSGNESVLIRFLFLTDGAATDVGAAIDDIHITGPQEGPVIADFSSDNSAGCIGHEVVFTNTSSGSVTGLSWDFGTGSTPSTATGIGPHTVIFSEEGISNVTLIASGTTGTDNRVIEISTVTPIIPTISQVKNEDGSVVLNSSNGDSYQWFRDGVLLEGEIQSSLSVNDLSLYTVAVTTNGCEQTSDPYQIVLGVEENNLREIVFYPTPVIDVLKISVPDQLKIEIESVEILNLSGKQLGKFDYQEEIDISNFDSGLYLVRMRYNNTFLTRRILKN